MIKNHGHFLSKLFDSAYGVISYLIGCMEHPETTGKIYEIDGHDKMTYGGLAQVYAASLNKNLRNSKYLKNNSRLCI